MKNAILQGNNAEIMAGMEFESVDLVYMDPPFNSGVDYEDRDGNVQFTDKFDSMDDYLGMLRPVLQESHRLLKDTGSVFVHVDPTVSHYLKIELDKIFGIRNFRNEIIWHYRKWTNTAKFC